MCWPTGHLAKSCLLLVLTTACSNSTDSSPVPQELTASVGAVTRDEAVAALDGLSLGSLLTPVGASAGGSASCATPSDPTDSDGDGVPDDATWSFTAPPCRFADYRGGTLDVVGDLRLVDPTPDAAGFGYEATLTALRATFTTGGNTPLAYSVTRNGTRSLSGSVTGLQLSSDLQIVRTFSGLADAAVDEQWVITFTPTTPLQINQAAPSGTLDIAGTLNWTRGSEVLDLTVTTPTPIHYDASCTGDARRFDGGELRAAGSFDGTTGYVELRWTGCGKDPDVRFVAS